MNLFEDNNCFCECMFDRLGFLGIAIYDVLYNFTCFAQYIHVHTLKTQTLFINIEPLMQTGIQ